MPQPRKPAPEPGVTELLSEEITRLLMRADRVERREVEALVTRVKAPKPAPAPRAFHPVKREVVP